MNSKMKNINIKNREVNTSERVKGYFQKRYDFCLYNIKYSRPFLWHGGTAEINPSRKSKTVNRKLRLL